MLQLSFILFSLLVLSHVFIVEAKQEKYDAKCVLNCGVNSTQSPCTIALYSVWHTFDIKNAHVMLFDSKLCSLQSQSWQLERNTVGVVGRGECPFDVKTKHATELGLAALIIVNTDSDVFLFGDSHSKQVDDIPTVMVGNVFWNYLLGIKCDSEQLCTQCSVDISYESREKPRLQSIDGSSITPLAAWLPAAGFLSIGGAVVTILLSAVCTSLRSFSKRGLFHDEGSTEPMTLDRKWMFIVSIIIFLIVSIICGVTTLRKRTISEHDKFMMTDLSYVSPHGNKEVTYNHRETDEMIFETLTSTISNNFWDYSLQSSGIIETFNLSRENYDYDIFIHPPFFVYSLYFLFHSMGVPLVVASIIFHTLTAALVPPILFSLLNTISVHGLAPRISDSHFYLSSTASLWATVIFILCPIGRICSQKIWIDNAAAFTSTAAAYLHLSLHQKSRYLTHDSMCYRNLLSGFIYGFIVLNCKVTSLAMLPFLLGWIVFIAIISHPTMAPKSFMSKKHLYQIITKCFYFMGGAFVGHGPWLCLYFRTTGRLLPSAWPSKAMIDNSPYLQAAVSRHLAAYFIDLFKFSPLQLIGLVFGTCAFAPVLHYLFLLLKEKRILSRNDICSDKSLKFLMYAVFALWPLGYVCGFTLVGGLGGGFQIRFILPILPATSILAGLASMESDKMLHILVALLLVYSGIHSFYYSILYSPLYADMHTTIFDVIRVILETPYEAPKGDITFMKHFGLKLD